MALAAFGVIAFIIYWYLLGPVKKLQRIGSCVKVAIIFIGTPFITMAGKLGFVSGHQMSIMILVVISIVLLFSVFEYIGLVSKNPLNVDAVIWLSVIIVGILIGSSGAHSLNAIFDDLPTFISIFLGVALVMTEGKSPSFHKSLAAAMGALSISSIIIYIVWPDFATISVSSLGLDGDYSGRLAGPLLHPNALGSLICLGSVFCLAHLGGLRRLLSVGALIVALVLTDQRSAEISFIVCIIVIVLMKRTHSSLGWFALTLSTLSAAAIALFLGNSITSDVIGARQASVSYRIDIYSFVVENLDTIIPFGIGVNGLYTWTQSSSLPIAFAHAHDSWLTMLVMGGLMAGCGFLILTVRAAFRAWRTRNYSYVAGIATVLTLSATESPIFAGSNWTIIPVATIAFFMLLSPQARPSIKGPLLRSKSGTVSLVNMGAL